MKKKFITIFSVLCLLPGIFSFTVSDEDRGDIRLEKQPTGTRSATSTIVEAYVEGGTLSMEVSRYEGDVYVQVYGSGGMRQTIFTSYGSGYGSMDISSLPAGTYTVSISVNAIYTGTLEKE